MHGYHPAVIRTETTLYWGSCSMLEKELGRAQPKQAALEPSQPSPRNALLRVHPLCSAFLEKYLASPSQIDLHK